MNQEGEVQSIREDINPGQYKTTKVFSGGVGASAGPLSIFVEPTGGPESNSTLVRKARAAKHTPALAGPADGFVLLYRTPSSANGKSKEGGSDDDDAVEMDAHKEGGRRGGLMAQAKASKQAAEAARRSGRKGYVSGGNTKVL